MLRVRVPTLLQPCSLFLSLYHHIDKAYGINISLPPYSNMSVVLTYLKSTYVFDCLQHLSTTLFLISITPLSMFHLNHNLQHYTILKPKLLLIMSRQDLGYFIDLHQTLVHDLRTKNHNNNTPSTM
jgi:hypothetical protein